MHINILGCSGGIGRGLKTTAFLVDDRLLVDAGSGVETLTLEQMLAIRSVLITHAHIDHILGLPLLLATIYDAHKTPVDVYALPQVIDALRTHIFNWTIWPDFSQLPEQRPILRFHALAPGAPRSIDGYDVEAIPAVHPTPAVGYLVRNGNSSFAFTGDSADNPDYWQLVNRTQPQLLIVDVSFTNDAAELARRSGHLTAEQLTPALSSLGYTPAIRLTHLKPGFEAEIEAQSACCGAPDIRPLQHGEQIHL